MFANQISWLPRFVDNFAGEKIHAQLVDFTEKVRTDPNHELRQAINKLLADLAEDLQHDPETIAKAERIKTEMLARTDIGGIGESAWQVAKRAILESADDPASTLRVKVAGLARRIGEGLRDGGRMRTQADAALIGAVRFVAENYGGEIASLITDPVRRWDADEASSKIELQVGRDLQFIRINGTVVGSLAGLAIHTVSELLLN
jgi:uncharacterized membrane-anchored protein YjiN (DUF445 family)